MRYWKIPRTTRGVITVVSQVPPELIQELQHLRELIAGAPLRQRHQLIHFTKDLRPRHLKTLARKLQRAARSRSVS